MAGGAVLSAQVVGSVCWDSQEASVWAKEQQL